MKTFKEFIKEANSVKTAEIKSRYHNDEGDNAYNEADRVRTIAGENAAKSLYRKGAQHKKAAEAADNIVNKHNWGYHGEVMRDYGISKAKTMVDAMHNKVKQHTGADDATAKEFLQSRMGRHLADSLYKKTDDVSAYMNAPDVEKHVKSHFNSFLGKRNKR